jgi:Bacterial conjugation TrbI-like protein
MSQNETSSALLTAEPPLPPASADLQKQLAGIDEQDESLIPDTYTIDPEQPTPNQRTTKDKPGLQTLFILFATGSVVAFGALFVVMSSGSSKKADKAAVKPSPAPEVVNNESAELKSKLAFQDQQQQINNQPTPRTSPTPGARPSKPPTTAPTASRAAAPASARSAYTPPAARSAPAATSGGQPAAVKPVDPFERWSQLATLGQSQGKVDESFFTAAQPAASPGTGIGAIAPIRATDPLSIGASPSPVPVSNSPQPTLVASSDISTVQIGSALSAGTTDGARGILSRTPQSQLSGTSARMQTVGLGTMVAAQVKMPMLWDMAGNNPPGMQRFTIALTEPMLAEDGSVALPAGTLFVAETHTVGAENNFVVASAVAVLYRGADGRTKQEAIPVGTVLIRGIEGNALVAQKLHDSGGAIAGQDLLVGALSALGRVGEIINQPESQTTTSGRGFSQTSTRSNPSVLAAVLEGAFETTAERLSSRSDTMVEEMLQRPNVLVLSGETEVSVVVNSLFRIAR